DVGAGRFFASDLADPVEYTLGAHERGAVRQLHRHQDIALVLDRKKSGSDAGEAIARTEDDDQGNRAHEGAARDHTADQPRVGALEGIIDGVEGAKEEVA